MKHNSTMEWSSLIEGRSSSEPASLNPNAVAIRTAAMPTIAGPLKGDFDCRAGRL
jgi:hypothetical protein